MLKRWRRICPPRRSARGERTLVKALVELHGGSVEARSDAADLGAEFTARLPLASAPVNADVTEADAPTRALRIRSGPVVPVLSSSALAAGSALLN